MLSKMPVVYLYQMNQTYVRTIAQRLRADVFVYVCNFVKRMNGAVHRRV